MFQLSVAVIQIGKLKSNFKCLMKFNFEEDLKTELQTGLDSFGIGLPDGRSLNEFLLDYLAIVKKIIRL